MSIDRPYKIAINALGGQGGGVLSGWLVQLAEKNGAIAQSTSVPGVAQRTGATVYYVEYFPKALADKTDQPPVLALMPVPGDVDIVLASEMIEAGRAIDRGFVSSKTTLITSNHRVYAIGEKIGMGDARVSTEAIEKAAQKVAGRFISADLQECVERTGSIISSVIFGALAGSGALPLERSAFEDVIRAGGRAVDTNLSGFAAGYEAVRDDGQAPAKETAPPFVLPENPAPAVRDLVAQISQMPIEVQPMALLGVQKVVDHSGVAYGELYLQRLKQIIELDSASQQYKNATLVAKHLALWMAYEDTIRVADLKTRGSRFLRFRNDVRAEEDQIVQVSEYFHPRLEEFCDILPAGLGRRLRGSKAAERTLGRLLGRGMRLPTTKLRGFIPLYCLASMKFLRRRSLKYKEENERIEDWLTVTMRVMPEDYVLATEIVRLQRLLKGYGSTWERGLRNFTAIMQRVDVVRGDSAGARMIAELHDAALADETSATLNQSLAAIDPTVQPGAA